MLFNYVIVSCIVILSTLILLIIIKNKKLNLENFKLVKSKNIKMIVKDKYKIAPSKFSKEKYQVEIICPDNMDKNIILDGASNYLKFSKGDTIILREAVYECNGKFLVYISFINLEYFNAFKNIYDEFYSSEYKNNADYKSTVKNEVEKYYKMKKRKFFSY